MNNNNNNTKLLLINLTLYYKVVCRPINNTYMYDKKISKLIHTLHLYNVQFPNFKTFSNIFS